MLKLASLSLVALLALASPSFAAKKCIPPTKFPDALKVAGDDLVKFKQIAHGLPDKTDLVLLLKAAPLAIAFSKGCAIGVGKIAAEPAKPADDGSI